MQNWISTEGGWVAFASDLPFNSTDPIGNPVDIWDGSWTIERNDEHELLRCRKTLSDGRTLTIYND